MYKRIPASRFDSLRDVFFCMIDFMQECGFSTVSTNAKHLFYNISDVFECYVLYDSYANHNLCFIYYNEWGLSDYENIALFVFDNYDDSKPLNEQEHVTMLKKEGYWKWSVAGVSLDFQSVFIKRINVSDLVCMYINKSLIFVYVPTNCYIYSHIYNDRYASGGGIIFYGNFTKYHLGYRDDTILCFSNRPYSMFQLDSEGRYRLSMVVKDVGELKSMVFCSPEASNTKGDNFWFVGLPPVAIYTRVPPKDPPVISTSFGLKIDNQSIFSVPDYSVLWLYTDARHKSFLGSTINNTSVLLPLVVYGMREPYVLHNWSAIGESKLVNLIDMSHISSGEIFIDNGIEKDLHKYFVFPALHDGQGIEFPKGDEEEEDEEDGPQEYKYENGMYSFTGIAVEIWAKEYLLKEQLDGDLIILLNDSYRNFDRIVIEYSGGVVEWLYDDLNDLYDTSGIFNLTKDDNNKCMVYGLRNENGESTEYRFTCSESCRIISIIGYRE